MKRLKIAYIHNEKKISTGAHYINELITRKLKENGVAVKNFYPRAHLLDGPHHLKGLTNILFFYSLLENKDEILKCDLIQGTTYTPLTFLPFDIPVICHFGSTTYGFLGATPKTKNLDKFSQSFYARLKKDGVIKELNIKTRKPMRDISAIEQYTATHADAVIATSENVKRELEKINISPEKITVVHNAIEDYWFTSPPAKQISNPHIVFLGRLGNSVFDFKLKGLDRIFEIFKDFPEVPKTIITITLNNRISTWLQSKVSNLSYYANIIKYKIPEIIHPLAGSVLFITSRYEGFSLSLIEGMSQGLIPVTYNVGVAGEVIKNGNNGFIVSSQAEAKQTIRMILNDAKMREELSNNARLTARLFKANEMAQKLKDVYCRVLKRAA